MGWRVWRNVWGYWDKSSVSERVFTSLRHSRQHLSATPWKTVIVLLPGSPDTLENEKDYARAIAWNSLKSGIPILRMRLMTCQVMAPNN
jgi:hypothetical protein